MLTIPPELQSFNDAVSGSIGTMNSTLDTISDKISSLSTSCTTATNEFSSYYNSENKEKIISKLSSISDVLSTLGSSLSSDLKGILSKCQELLDKIVELVKLKEAVEEQEKIRDDEYKKEEKERNTLTISNANSIISKGTADFNRIVTESTKLLNDLKSMDGSLDFVAQFSSTDYLAHLDSLQYGTFELKSFTASNGQVVDYYLYVPDYGQEIENLPCMLYMHGGSTHQNIKCSHAIQYGLSSKIASKEITPEGIVIMPVVRNFDNKGLAALKELTDHVVEEYKVDTDRISVSGHSYGGIAAYRLVNQNPDYFSCVVGISGSDKITESFKGMNVWEFVGTYENGDGLTSYGACSDAVKKINEVGGYAFFTPIKTGHAGTNKLTYEQEYTSPDGDKVNPLVWAFRQIKGKTGSKA